ncbi:hypothetical protein MKI84_08425 [Ancylobacter sp. A5.8]|uniref:hypothetical protein n=1 Tax=Ancylobacter gelatini TaxID=2919920 RepID=UPI001F4EC537|nr:hypothetical protein [Ancylobacter gelatini]MCJ8142940.1 hypothetical protein [Ancylobacter gelatini]
MFRYAPMSRWTVPIALRRMECRIEDAKAALADIAGIWGDVDQGAVDTADQIIVDLDRFLADQKAMVAEKIAAGEDVGP